MPEIKAAARPGDAISALARQRMAKQAPRLALRDGHPEDNFSSVVQRKTPGLDPKRGKWVCIYCGQFLANNFEAWKHQDERPKHRLAWHVGSGRIEAP